MCEKEEGLPTAVIVKIIQKVSVKPQKQLDICVCLPEVYNICFICLGICTG